MVRVKDIAVLMLIMYALLGWRKSHAQQSDCEQTLRKALDEFNAGHFYSVPVILKPCFENGFTREQRQRAYLLLTQSFLLIDDTEGAEDSYLKLLRANPEFTADDARDPIDVVYLSKKFTSEPTLSLFGKVGPNLTTVKVIQDVSLFDKAGLRKTYSVRPGWQFSLGADVNFTKHFSLSASLQYMMSSYERRVVNIFDRDEENFIDRQNWFNIPIAVKYNFTNVGLKPFIYGGFAARLLVADKAIIVFTDRLNAGEVKQQSSSPNMNFAYKRNLFNYDLYLGGGVKKKVGLNYLFVELRYSVGLNSIIRAQNLYANTDSYTKYTGSLDPVFRYGHVDDFIRLNNVSFSVGFIYPIYKPRKVKAGKKKLVNNDITDEK